MNIEPGQQLLHFRIVEKLGEGGMGVVWKAVDTTLDREVAIKFLPEWGVTAGPSAEERLVRFEREARLLASLNHPNIASVYGLHRTPDEAQAPFIAMEFVRGEDLAAHLRAGPLPLGEALAIARQVAAALASAHDNGVIHRDLKPANIRLSGDGSGTPTVKVLDFGLAKAFEASSASGSANLSLSPTLTSAGTRAGMILGTAAYMSPEQSRGKTVDRRTDIWAFGCVLYEMLTANAAFGGETVTDVLAAIIKGEPDVGELAGKVPPRVLRLLQRCLEKDPARRLRDAADIGLELDEILAGDLQAPAAVEATMPARSARGPLALVTVAALALGAVLGYLASGTGGAGTAPAGEPLRMAVTAGEAQPIRAVKISNSGRFMLLRLDDGAYVRRLDSYELRAIPDSLRLAGWVDSPDGQSIVFFSQDDRMLGSGKLLRMSLQSGLTVTLRESAEVLVPVAWAGDTLIAVKDRGSKLWRVRADTGEPELLFELDVTGHMHGATATPGGQAVIAEMHAGAWNLVVIDLQSGQVQEIVANATGGVVTSSGHLLFLRDGTLMASLFDGETLRPVGAQVPLYSGVRSFSVSRDGTLAYLPAAEGSEGERLLRLAADGSSEVLLEGAIVHIRYSPDGRWISVNLGTTFRLYDRRTGSVRTLPGDVTMYSDHVWRPDSRAVVYTAYTGDTSRRCAIVEHPLEGGSPRTLVEFDASQAEVFPTGYAPDGSGFIFSRYESDDTDLWWMPAGGGEPQVLLDTSASEDLARFSPDGRWVAYESNESGLQEIWVARYDAGAGRLTDRWQVSNAGGQDAMWSPDGREVFYEDFNDQLVGVTMEAPAGAPDDLTVGARRIVHDLRSMGVLTDSDESYAIAPSGDEMIFVQDTTVGATEVRVVLNWLEELKRLVPGG